MHKAKINARLLCVCVCVRVCVRVCLCVQSSKRLENCDKCQLVNVLLCAMHNKSKLNYSIREKVIFNSYGVVGRVRREGGGNREQAIQYFSQLRQSFGNLILLKNSDNLAGPTAQLQRRCFPLRLPPPLACSPTFLASFHS